MAKPMSKSDLISKLAEENSDKLSRKDVKSVLETLASVGYKELKKNGTFLLPGFAKFVVIRSRRRRSGRASTRSPRSRRSSRPSPPARCSRLGP